MKTLFLSASLLIVAGSAAFTVSTSTADTTDPSLVAHYTFDEGSGTTSGDSSGNNNTGTLVYGPLWTTGNINGALHFDGRDDHVVVDNNPSLEITGTEITLAAWINPHNAGAFGGSRVISKRTDSGGSDVYAMYSQHNRLRFRLDGTDMVSSNTFNLNEWVHIAMVYNGIDKRIYWDGVLDPAAPQTKTDAIDPSSRPVHLGMREGQARFFDGLSIQWRRRPVYHSETVLQRLMQYDSLHTA